MLKVVKKKARFQPWIVVSAICGGGRRRPHHCVWNMANLTPSLSSRHRVKKPLQSETLHKLQHGKNPIHWSIFDLIDALELQQKTWVSKKWISEENRLKERNEWKVALEKSPKIWSYHAKKLQLHHWEGAVEFCLDQMITSRHGAGVFVIKTHTHTHSLIQACLSVCLPLWGT